MANEVIRKDVNFVTLLGGISNTVAQDIIQLRVDSITSRLLVDSLSIQSGHETVGDGTATVTTAGTRVQFPNIACKKVIITANVANVSKIWVGGSTVVEGQGIPLNQGFSVQLNPNNLNLLYIDADIGGSGDGISYYYET